MTTQKRSPVQLTEVGPRDGLQSDGARVSTAVKIAYIESLVEAGKDAPQAPTMTPVEPVQAPAARSDVLDELTAGKRSAAGEAATQPSDASKPDEAEPSQPKSDVLDRLMGGDKK